MQKIHPAIVKGIIGSTIGVSPAGAIVYCQGATDTLENNGFFYFDSISPGNISVFTYLFNHKPARLDTVVLNGDSLNLSIVLEPGENEFFDDFEIPPTISYLFSGDWEKGIPSSGPNIAYSGVNVWATNLNGNYSNGGVLSSLETPEISIMGLARPMLECYHWYSFESGKDGGNVKITMDNGQTWQVIFPLESYPVAALPAGNGNPLAGEPAYSGQQPFWKEVTFDLSAYSTYPVIKLRFDVGVDQTGNAPGWYIDDLHIFDGNVVNINNEIEIAENKLPTLKNYPNPFNPVTRIFIDLPQNSEIDLSVYDIRGALVKSIIKNKFQRGSYRFTWNGINNAGSRVASGVYFLNFSTDYRTLNRKLLLIR